MEVTLDHTIVHANNLASARFLADILDLAGPGRPGTSLPS